jgi:hypothetical protein
MLVMRLARAGFVVTAFAVFVLAASAGCSSGEEPQAAESPEAVESDPARELERKLFANDSHARRYSHPLCVEVGAPFTFVCTVQRIDLRSSHDAPLMATGFTPSDETASGYGTGMLDIPVECATDVRCWVEELCRVSRERCTTELTLSVFPDLGPNEPPEQITREVCVDAWNVHGGFSADELAMEEPAEPDWEVDRPAYEPHLAAPTLGFLGPRADVRAMDGTCSVVFDLGDGNAYTVDATVDHAPRFWTWAGREATSTVAAEGQSWNACQEADGTLSLGDGCTGGLQARDLANELDRRVLQQVSEAGGRPFWLGLRFLGSLPERTHEKYKDTIKYTVETPDGPLRLRVLTYRPPRPRVVARGFEVFRAQTSSATVLVVANRRPSRRVVMAVRSDLRPFRGSDPYAEQDPTDLVADEPTRVDTSVRVRVYWAGPASVGLEADVLEDAPAGLGIVRYGPSRGPNTFYLVTYKPKKKTRCSSNSCVSPPAPPASFRRYGVHVNAAIYYEPQGEWIVEVLAPSKKHAELTNEALLALTRLR